MKVFLSGVESSHAYKTIQAVGFKSVVLNYSYLKKKKDVDEILHSLKESGCRIMLDPGSDSMLRLFGWYDPETLTIRDPEHLEAFKESSHTEHIEYIRHEWRKISAYNRRYRDFCVLHQELLDDILEMGYTALVDGKFILQQRRMFADLPLVPQYTPTTDTYTYVYTTSLGNEPEKYQEIFADCKFKGIRLHGKSITRSKLLRALPFYSVDTASWLYGGKYGTIYKYAGGLKAVRLADTRHTPDEILAVKKQLKTQVIAAGIDWLSFETGGYEAINQWNAEQWKLLATDAETLKASSEYWISQQERTEIVEKKRAGLEKFSLAVREAEAVSKIPEERTKIALDKRQHIGRMCNTCVIADSCPEWNANSMCKLTNITALDDFEDVKDTFGGILSIQRDRLMHKSLVERLTGIDNERLTEEIESFTRMTKNFNDVINGNRASISLEATGDGVGVLGALIANMGGTSPSKHNNDPMTEYTKQRDRKQVVEDMKRENDTIEAEFTEYTEKKSAAEWSEDSE